MSFLENYLIRFTGDPSVARSWINAEDYTFLSANVEPLLALAVINSLHPSNPSPLFTVHRTERGKGMFTLAVRGDKVEFKRSHGTSEGKVFYQACNELARKAVTNAALQILTPRSATIEVREVSAQGTVTLVRTINYTAEQRKKLRDCRLRVIK